MMILVSWNEVSSSLQELEAYQEKEDLQNCFHIFHLKWY